MGKMTNGREGVDCLGLKEKEQKIKRTNDKRTEEKKD